MFDFVTNAHLYRDTLFLGPFGLFVTTIIKPGMIFHVTLIQVELADRFMDFLGKTIGKRDWQLTEVDVTKIIVHPGYSKSGITLARI